MKKAQAEFFTILGILLLVVIVLFYGYLGGWFGDHEPLPPGVQQTQQLVTQSVTDAARDCVRDVLIEMENHGGYLPGDNAPGIVQYLGYDVALWQACDDDISPSKSDIKNKLEDAVKHCMDFAADDFIESFASQNVSFDKNGLLVNANILDNSVEVYITLPTDVHGYEIEQPYSKAIIPTTFGRVLDFSKDFVAEYVQDPSDDDHSGRFFEAFTLLSLYHNKYLPTIGVLPDCGDSIHMDSSEIDMRLAQTITYVLANTRLWKGIENNGRSFGVPSISGKQYTDIKDGSYGFFLPDDFTINSMSPIIIHSSKPIYTSFPFVVGECLTTYHQTYSLYYPIVVRVEDPLLEHAFNFGLVAYISSCKDSNGNYYCDEDEDTCSGGEDCGMYISDCDSIGGFVGGGESECEERDCTATLKVTDTSGNSLEGVHVFFNGCPVGNGMTGSDGNVGGDVKCGTGKLQIYYTKDYEFYNEEWSSADLDGSIIALYGVPDTTWHFREIEILGMSGLPIGEEATKTSRASPCIGTGGIYTHIACIADSPSNTIIAEFDSTDRSNEWFITNINSGSADDFADEFEECRADCEDAKKDCKNGCTEPPENKTQEECEGDCEDDYRHCEYDCSSTFLEHMNVLETRKVDYIHAGPYDIETELWNYDEIREVGGFFAQETIPENADELYMNVPLLGMSTYDIETTQKQCLVDMISDCGLEAIDGKAPASVTVLDCSCYALKIISEETGCLSEDDIEANFCAAQSPTLPGSVFPDMCEGSCIGVNPADCTLYCDAANVTALLEMCGAEFLCEVEE